jgi:hypothetical protein
MNQLDDFSTTLSLNQQDVIFYNMVGNFIPPEWKNLTNSSGKVLSKTSRQLLSLIVFKMESAPECAIKQDNTELHQLHELQEGYYFFQSKLGVCQRRVRQCFVELQQAGFINVELLTVIKHHIKCRIPSIKLLKNFKNSHTINAAFNAKKFPSERKDFSAEPEKSFRLERNNFPAHYIVDNNISILESRSSESGFVNFLADDSSSSGDQQKIEQYQDKNDDKNQTTPESVASNWLTKVATKAKNFCKTRKKLSEFHPLDEADASWLQLHSAREFNLSFINKLLLKLAEQYPDHSFPSKKAVLSYMTKALAHELRDSCKVNNESFQFKQDPDTRARENYLQEVESGRDTSQTSQFRRKIAAVFAPEVAYKLLTSCSFNDPQDDCYSLLLIKDILISEPLQEALLKEAKAVYGSSLRSLAIIQSAAISHKFANKKTATETIDNYAHLQGLDSESVWFKIRQCLIETWGVNIDKNWFSKLELVEEDLINKKILLKPHTSFIGYWINQNYQAALEKAFLAKGFSFEMTKY